MDIKPIDSVSKGFGNKWAILFIVLFAGCLYALTIKGVNYNVQPGDFKNNLDQPTRPLELSPERGRFAHVIALAENHTYALDSQLADAVYPDVGYHGDKFFSFFAPGMSYMALPLYIVGSYFNLSQVFTFSLVSIFSILALIFLFKIAREILKFPIWISLVCVLIFAFGSTAWSYSITLYQHHLSVFFIMSGFYSVWKFKAQASMSWLWALWVWAAYGLAIFIDYPNMFLMLPVMVYLLIVSVQIRPEAQLFKISLRPAAIATFAAFMVFTALHFYHNTHYFGAWNNLSGTLPRLRELREHGALENDLSLKDIQGQQEASGFFKEKNISFSFFTLTVSPDRGLFLYAPIFILALFGIYFVVKKLNLEYGILIGLLGVNIFLYSSWDDPWGGWAFGPRYLIPSMAVLCLFLGTWLKYFKHRSLAKVITFLLFAYSAAIGLLGALTTNAVPPKVEGLYLHAKYNFLFNWQFLKDGHSSSFLYNSYFSKIMSLNQYFLLIYGSLLLIMIIIMVYPRSKADSRY